MFEEVLIITPFYNSYSAFERTFKSVVEQTHKRFEWIIVDDCSDNGQFTKLRNLVSQEKRIKLVRNKKNLGAGPARNLGLSFFNHKYLTFIDSDDEWHKNFISEMIQVIRRERENFIFCGYNRIIIDKSSHLDPYVYQGTLKPDDILKGNPISCLTAFIKPIPGLPLPQFGNTPLRNDLIFMYSMLKQTGTAKGIDKVLATYIIRSKSLSRNKLQAAYWQWYVYRNVANKNFLASAYFLFSWIIYGIKKYS